MMETTLALLQTLPPATPAAMAVFALLAASAAHLAARRSVAQPLPQDVAAEAAVLAAVCARPDLYAKVSELTPEAFSDPLLRRAWVAVTELLAPPEPEAQDPEAESPEAESLETQDADVAPQRSALGSGELVAAVRGVLAAAGSGFAGQVAPGAAAWRAAWESLEQRGDAACGAGGRDAGLLDAGRTLLGWQQDRLLYRGVADWEQDEGGNLVRTFRPPSRLRVTVLAFLGAAAGLSAALTAPAAPTLVWLAHLASLAALTVLAAVIASVDFDTLLIDLEATVVGVLVAAAPATFVAFARDGWRPVALLVAATVGLVLLLKAAELVTLAAFSLLARLSRLRARSERFDAYVADRSALTSALGSGDLWLVPAAFGVPYLLVGSVSLLVVVLVVAGVTAIAGHVLARLRGRGRFAAFGPHLMWAWVAALALDGPAERLLLGL